MSFPRYPNYKPSGVEWLGEVPEHWELPKLKTIASFSGGGTPNRENRDYWNGEIPWVSPKDMKSERIINSEESITQDGLINSSSNLLQSGHVLMVVRSGILKHTIPIAINDVAVSLNQDMKALNFDIERCLGQFFFRWVQGLNNQLLLAWAKQGATVESIEHSYLVDTVVPLPSIDEQIIIISFLDRETAKIDALVAEQQRLIELLKEKRQAVISHAVTKGLDPTVPMKPSGIEWLGDIPAHWSVMAMRMIAQIVRGASPRPAGDPRFFGGDDVPWVTVGEITKDDYVNLTATEFFLTREGSTHSTLFTCGTVIYSNSGATLGVPKILAIDACANDGVVAFTKLSESVAPEFLYYYLDSITCHIRDKIRQGSGQPNLNTDIIKDLRMGLPSLDEQRTIVDRIEGFRASFGSLIFEAERAIELLQERRTALISAAVTGQIDVRQLAQGVAA